MAKTSMRETLTQAYRERGKEVASHVEEAWTEALHPPTRRCSNVGPYGGNRRVLGLESSQTGGTKMASRMEWELSAQQRSGADKEQRSGDALPREHSFIRDHGSGEGLLQCDSQAIQKTAPALKAKE